MTGTQHETSRHAVVVGAGVVGTACAHFLREDGWRVSVLDQAAEPSGCSYGNCGYVSPSHVLPLCVPGAVRTTLSEMRQSEAPIKIRPGLSPQRWLWLLRFARNCHREQMLNGAAAIHKLLVSSRQLYSKLICDFEIDCQFTECGLLMVYRSREALDAFASTNELLASRFDTPAIRLDGDEVRRMEPMLNDAVAGAWHYPGDAYLRPDQLMRSWHRSLQERGVTFHFDCPVEAIHDSGDAPLGVKTPAETHAADLVVAATGAFTGNFASALGVKLPIQPGKGYSITFAKPDGSPRMPMLLPEAHVGITPWQDGVRLGSMMEIVGFDTSLRERRLDVLRKGAESVLRGKLEYREAQPWFGWRPMTPDSVPFIDRSPRSDRILIAAGHNMLGLSMAPATGKLVAELASNRTPHLDTRPYRIGR